MSYAIKHNNAIVLECLVCGEDTDHYPVEYGNDLHLECEPCILSKD